KAPDGSPFAPRKSQPVRAKRGRIKREMFVKLRTNRYLKASGNDSAAVVEFTGKVQRIARVHQFGLIDNPSPKYNKVKYIERELLGFSICDNKFINELIIKFLDG
ncbi:phage virion morphogenesis protein, partial [Klebsiella pneumoniae]|uniref:phage virion morphogenesis protein n=1 Tax=Klebsiella pneumoniae TaxID=573 RepID=UPI00071D765B